MRLPAKNRPYRWKPEEMIPSAVQLGLDDETVQQIQEGIQRLEGAFYAIKAETLVHVDLPFEASESWTPLIEGIQIRIHTAKSDRESYHYRIDQKGEDPYSTYVGKFNEKDLPKRIVVACKFLSEDDRMIGEAKKYRYSTTT